MCVPMVCPWGSQDNVCGVASLLHLSHGSRDWTQILRVKQQALYPLSHLADPQWRLLICFFVFFFFLDSFQYGVVFCVYIFTYFSNITLVFIATWEIEFYHPHFEGTEAGGCLRLALATEQSQDWIQPVLQRSCLEKPKPTRQKWKQTKIPHPEAQKALWAFLNSAFEIVGSW